MTVDETTLTRTQADLLGADELEDLPGFLDNITFALEADGCLLIYGVLEGKHLGVNIDGGLGTLNALTGRVADPIVYVDARYWDAEQITTRRERIEDDDLLSPQDITTATQALNESEAHLGEVATLALSIVAGGVAHEFNFRAGWFLATQPTQAATQEREQRWEARVNEQDQEREKVHTLLEDLADQLIVDDPFLRLTSEGTRRVRADQLAKPLVGPDLMHDLGVRGAIAQAVRVATARRAEEIIPARTAALREKIPQLADELRSDLEFTAATTSKARDRCARALLAATDPVADRTALITRLVSMALAVPPAGQPLLDI